jgi:hypothetical protein
MLKSFIFFLAFYYQVEALLLFVVIKNLKSVTLAAIFEKILYFSRVDFLISVYATL